MLVKVAGAARPTDNKYEWGGKSHTGQGSTVRPADNNTNWMVIILSRCCKASGH